MPLITPDFSEVTSNTIPEGTYPARIKDYSMKKSQAGNDYVEWTLELFGNPTVNNRLVWYRTPITGKGAFRLQQLYKAVTGQTLTTGQSFDTDSIANHEITVTLVDSKDPQGTTRTEVKTVTAYKQ